MSGLAEWNLDKLVLASSRLARQRVSNAPFIATWGRPQSDQRLDCSLNARITKIPQGLELLCSRIAASNSKRIVKSRRRQTSRAVWLTVVCMAMLLMATAQATHFCQFQIPNAHEGSQVASSSSPVCLMCLMASSATAAIMFVVFFSRLRSRTRAFSAQPQPRPFLHSFRLYVRPPPSD